MTDATPPSPPVPSRPASQDVRPTALQAVVTLVGGLVLAAGSCAGFLGTLNFNRDSAVNVAFALGFLASLIAAGVGLVLVVVRQVRMVRRSRATALPTPSAAAGQDAAAAAGGTATIATTRHAAAWQAFLVAVVLLVAAVGFVLLLVAVDPNPAAILFLLLAAGSGIGSLIALVIAAIRYSGGRQARP